MKNKIIIIVITGAASSGKTTVIKMLSKQMASEGIPVFTLQETATELLESGFNTATDKKLFQSSLFDFQFSKERIYREYIASFAKEKAVLLIDRSLLDGAVYISDEDFSDIIFKYGLTKKSILARYDAVIQLQTSAFVTDYSRSDNNEYRIEESAEECIGQDKKLKELYLTHDNYSYVKSEADFDAKFNRVCSIVKSLI